MRAILTDGHTVPCENFKAIDSGVVLFEDDDRERVSGFVPHDRLVAILPDDAATGVAEAAAPDESTRDGQDREDEGADRADTTDRGESTREAVREDETTAVETDVTVTVGDPESETGDEREAESDVTTVEVTYEEAEDDSGDHESEPDAATEAESDNGGETDAESDNGGETDAESDNGGETDAESETDTDESELDSIRGLGPTYINRLREAGIETREDLRRADVAEVAEAADVAPSRADDWKRQVS